MKNRITVHTKLETGKSVKEAYLCEDGFVIFFFDYKTGVIISYDKGLKKASEFANKRQKELN